MMFMPATRCYPLFFLPSQTHHSLAMSQAKEILPPPPSLLLCLLLFAYTSRPSPLSLYLPLHITLSSALFIQFNSTTQCPGPRMTPFT